MASMAWGRPRNQSFTKNDLRFLQRSTESHNTVKINDKNSSAVWSSFRVGKKSQVFNTKIWQHGRNFWLTKFKWKSKFKNQGYFKVKICQFLWSKYGNCGKFSARKF